MSNRQWILEIAEQLVRICSTDGPAGTPKGAGIPVEENWTDDATERAMSLHIALSKEFRSSIPLYLNCPICHARHIDEGEFATKPHHTHSCQSCGLSWRPAIENTVGVRFLPGFKNPE